LAALEEQPRETAAGRIGLLSSGFPRTPLQMHYKGNTFSCHPLPIQQINLKTRTTKFGSQNKINHIVKQKEKLHCK
jgi:hypothetical protein